MTAQSESPMYLFGGSTSWHAQSWVVSDDRVRGGRSRSHLECASACTSTSASAHGSESEEGKAAVRFHGVLDTTALGGAGFASQRSPPSPSRRWDLSSSHGLRLRIREADGMRYTLVVKDTVSAERVDGRLQSTVSWEYDFEGRAGELCVCWGDFGATYRGRPKPDAEPLDLADVRSVSIMVRSFFGQQEGPFNLELEHIAAFRSPE
ncbi:NADH:ubiquinone oxidoreductase intermediate-associated protein 30 [Xylaria sp. FL1042]|nr:NADH:ubiquinone oxidoreductase intermediate-associated protein 30 [Xylaria sp. FL1042]